MVKVFPAPGIVLTGDFRSFGSVMSTMLQP